jgi:hypothetical protein
MGKCNPKKALQEDSFATPRENFSPISLRKP